MSKLIDNNWKASQPSYIKGWRSLYTIPTEFWDEARTSGYKGPREWDAIVCPKVAQSYKSGLIIPYHEPNPTGRAIAATHRMLGEMTMHIDYAKYGMPLESTFAHIRDWRRVDVLKIASKYAVEHLEARFALLRSWSLSHF